MMNEKGVVVKRELVDVSTQRDLSPTINELRTDQNLDLNFIKEEFQVDKCTSYCTNHIDKSLNQQSNIEFHRSEPNMKKEFNNNNALLLFTCDLCNKSFRRKYNLRLHMKFIHANIYLRNKKYKRRVQNHIGKRQYFTQNKALDKKLFSCEICSKQLKTRHGLTYHLNVHMGIKPYECGICLKKFISNSALVKHAIVHTGEKPYECSSCGKTFAQRYTLVIHLRVHTGERPYVCKVCQKTFSIFSTLKEHALLHTKEKTYTCEICKKNFTQRSVLQQHKKLHTGVRQYTCDLCPKNFAQRSVLFRHKKLHSRVKQLK